MWGTIIIFIQSNISYVHVRDDLRGLAQLAGRAGVLCGGATSVRVYVCAFTLFFAKVVY